MNRPGPEVSPRNGLAPSPPVGANAGQERAQDASLGELFSELASQTSTLFQQEVRLAKAELKGEATKAANEIKVAGAGGALAHAGAFAVVAAVIIALSAWIPLWLSALGVGVGVLAVGYGLMKKGVEGLKKVDPVPAKAVRALTNANTDREESTPWKSP